MKRAVGLSLAILSMVTEVNAQPRSERLSGTYLYQSVELNSYFLVKVGRAETGPISRKTRARSTAVMTDDTTSSDAFNCSTAKYSCAQFGRMLLAIPRLPLKATSSYEVEGTVFSVRKCMQGDQSNCRAALIEADCQQISGDYGCTTSSGGRSVAAHPGPLTYFIFRSNRGITSFGFADEKPKDEHSAIKLANNFVLRGDHGLLR